MDIENVQETIFTDFSGKEMKQDVFNTESEKNRASKIAKQLKGLTIYEAQEFLKKVSESFIHVYKL